MEIIIIAIVAVVMVVIGYFMGIRGKDNNSKNSEIEKSLRAQIAELNEKVKTQENVLADKSEQIRTLTSERDVQATHAENNRYMLTELKSNYEKQIAELKSD